MSAIQLSMSATSEAAIWTSTKSILWPRLDKINPVAMMAKPSMANGPMAATRLSWPRDARRSDRWCQEEYMATKPIPSEPTQRTVCMAAEDGQSRETNISMARSTAAGQKAEMVMSRPSGTCPTASPVR